MKSKDKNDEFVPWEEEESLKKKPERGDSIPPRTSQKSKVYSKPKSDDQEYLDMYIMLREKERIENYGKTLSKQHKNTAQAWRGIKGEILKRGKELPKTAKGDIEDEEGESSIKPIKTKKAPRNIKTLDWDY